MQVKVLVQTAPHSVCVIIYAHAASLDYIFYYYQRVRRKMAVCWWLTTGGLFLMAWGLEANLAEGGIYIYSQLAA